MRRRFGGNASRNSGKRFRRENGFGERKQFAREQVRKCNKGLTHQGSVARGRDGAAGKPEYGVMFAR